MRLAESLGRAGGNPFENPEKAGPVSEPTPQVPAAPRNHSACGTGKRANTLPHVGLAYANAAFANVNVFAASDLRRKWRIFAASRVSICKLVETAVSCGIPKTAVAFRNNLPAGGNQAVPRATDKKGSPKQLRGRSLGTRLSEAEYAQCEQAAARRGQSSLSEWCRQVLLDAAASPAPAPEAEAILSEVPALRKIAIDLLYGLDATDPGSRRYSYDGTTAYQRDSPLHPRCNRHPHLRH